MTKPTIMPVGIIEQSTGDSATFTLTRPGDPNILKIKSSVMVRNTHWDQNEIPSGAMVRGYVTEIGPTTAKFKVVESRTGPHWPNDADTLAPGCFVHLALLPDSFDLDRSQIATQKETEFLERIELAQQVKEAWERKASRMTTASPSLVFTQDTDPNKQPWPAAFSRRRRRAQTSATLGAGFKACSLFIVGKTWPGVQRHPSFPKLQTAPGSPGTKATQGQASSRSLFYEGKRGIMTKKRILLLGFIDRTTNNGAITVFTRPGDSHTLRPEPQLTFWSRYRFSKPCGFTCLVVVSAPVRYIEVAKRGIEPP